MKPSVFQCAGPPLEEVSRRPSRRAAFQPTRGDPCGLGAPPTRASLASKTYPFFFCRINLIRSPVTSMGSCPSQAMMKHKSPGRERRACQHGAPAALASAGRADTARLQWSVLGPTGSR